MSKRLLFAAAGSAAALAVYATLIEPRWLRVHRQRIHVRNLHPDLEGLRIGLLTDIHAGWTTPRSVLRRAVARMLVEAPDLVAITGDLVNDDPELLPDVAADLGVLRAPLGVYTVPGNHDYVAGIDAWRAALAPYRGIVDLTNASATVAVGAARLCVAGLDDDREGQPLLHVPPPEARDVTVVLAHSPDQAERLRRTGDDADLVLSGHTHGGQVRLPGLPAPVNSAEHAELYEAGVRRRPWTQVYTSRGLGQVALPVRFFTPPEVGLLTLTGAPRPTH